jgi:hypothetical protein
MGRWLSGRKHETANLTSNGSRRFKSGPALMFLVPYGVMATHSSLEAGFKVRVLVGQFFTKSTKRKQNAGLAQLVRAADL